MPLLCAWQVRSARGFVLCFLEQAEWPGCKPLHYHHRPFRPFSPLQKTPVSIIREYTSKYHLPSPVFEVEMTPSNTFKSVCKVGGVYTGEGVDSQKNGAKQKSALAVILGINPAASFSPSGLCTSWGVEVGDEGSISSVTSWEDNDSVVSEGSWGDEGGVATGLLCNLMQ
ncbi:hypothetical protein TrRE_jg3913, partial [Triparma retinervis]